jgi:hypothetical protein
MKKTIILFAFASIGLGACTETNKKDVETKTADTAVLKDHNHAENDGASHDHADD